MGMNAPHAHNPSNGSVCVGGGAVRTGLYHAFRSVLAGMLHLHGKMSIRMDWLRTDRF